MRPDEDEAPDPADVLRPAETAIPVDETLTPPSDFPDPDAVDGVGVSDDDPEPLPEPDDAEPQPEDTPAEGYGPDSGPEVADDCCPHGYFVGRDCPNGCVDDEGQRAEPPVVKAEPVFDAEGNITEFSILGDEEEAATEDEFGSDLDDEDESEDATHPIDALLTAIHDKGWNGALDALAAKFSATGAFLEVSTAIEKLRK